MRILLFQLSLLTTALTLTSLNCKSTTPLLYDEEKCASASFLFSSSSDKLQCVIDDRHKQDNNHATTTTTNARRSDYSLSPKSDIVEEGTYFKFEPLCCIVLTSDHVLFVSCLIFTFIYF